ncbi:MAG: hypothetical protein RIG77_10370 [Cyclobacteriaceae bacterium]
MKKVLFFLMIGLGISTATSAQNQNDIDERSDWQERIFMGGNMGLQVGNQTYVNLSPTMGYRITNALSAGVGVSYIYTKAFGQSRTHYGGNVFGRANIADPFFAMVQYEYLSVDVGVEGRRLGLKSFLVGGGIQQPLGGNAVASFTVMYNLSYVEGEPSAYNSPIVIGGGITLGF